MGDGWLGVELLKSVGVKRYLGVDLSDDSLAQTRGALRRRVSQRVATSSHHRRTCRSTHSRRRGREPVDDPALPVGGVHARVARNVSQSGASRVVLHFCGPCNASAHARELISCGGWGAGRGATASFGMGARCLMTTEAALGELRRAAGALCTGVAQD